MKKHKIKSNCLDSVTLQNLDSGSSGDPASGMHKRELLLLFVAFHPAHQEVLRLQACLSCLPQEIGYAVVVNSYRAGEDIEILRDRADFFLTVNQNLGYGRAINLLANRIGCLPPYIGILNTDLSWQIGTFERLLYWLQENNDVSLAVPQILDNNGIVQKFCKRNPSLLGLISRRFIPHQFKPKWLHRYDEWYVMHDHSYHEIFEVSYLSGCCMLAKSKDFIEVGGFDENYFLYLEDADLTRVLSNKGKCIHLPISQVVHNWGKGSYKSLELTFVNILSSYTYFKKWGVKII